MSVVTIMQPAYLPWLGYFDRIALADRLIVLDHVPMDHSSKTRFANRNRIKTANGPTWLTVPLDASQSRDTPIDALNIAGGDKDWRRRHLASIELSYRRASHFETLWPELGGLIGSSAGKLVAVTGPMLAAFMARLGIDRPVAASSAMDPQSRKSALILELCRKAGATSYISGPFGRDYLDRGAFEEAGIELLFHDYRHPVYRQLHGDFVPFMSILDLLLNEGPDSLSILASDRSTLARQ